MQSVVRKLQSKSVESDFQHREREGHVWDLSFAEVESINCPHSRTNHRQRQDISISLKPSGIKAKAFRFNVMAARLAAA